MGETLAFLLGFLAGGFAGLLCIFTIAVTATPKKKSNKTKKK